MCIAYNVITLPIRAIVWEFLSFYLPSVTAVFHLFRHSYNLTTLIPLSTSVAGFFFTIINSTSANIFMHKTLSAFFYLYYFPSAESLKQKCLVKAVGLLPDCFQCGCTNQTAALLVDFLCFYSWPLVCRLDLPFLPWERTDICTAQSWVGLVSLPLWHSVGSERKSPAPPAMVLSIS